MTWIYGFVASCSVKTQLELILVVAAKDSRKSLRITFANMRVLTSMNAGINTFALKMPFVKTKKEIISALVIPDSTVKHVRTLMNALSIAQYAMLTLIVTILKGASNVHVEKVLSEQV